MTFETTEDLPKQYQELADDAGFQSVFNSLESAPADMLAVAEVEKRGELTAERLEGLVKHVNAKQVGRDDLTDKLRNDIFKDLDPMWSHESEGLGSVRTNGWTAFWIFLALALGAINTYGIFF